MEEQEQADQVVWDRLTAACAPTEEISDTGTVENLMDSFNLTLTQVALGEFTTNQLLDSVAWL